jgi:uncharacterized repeat protein (TIGR03803 family)
LETRVTPAYSLSTLISFKDSIGVNPAAGLISDASGILYGTTRSTIYELAPSTGQLATISLYPVNPTRPAFRLVMDHAGNLFGTSVDGGLFDAGTVFELPKGSNSVKILVNLLDPPAGAFGNTGLILGNNGLLYGATQSAVFQIPDPTGPLTVLASLLDPDGLVLDNAGNLFGHYGTGLFELPHGQGPVFPLASFSGTNGQIPLGAMVMDASGNVYGTTAEGGPSWNGSSNTGYGTVFELEAGSGTITTLAAFNGINGQFPAGGIIMDGAGNLYGTTAFGGASNQGTVFEVANGSHTITTLASFNGNNGANPYDTLLLDSSGNLFVTTEWGGANNLGTVFKLQSMAAIVPESLSWNTQDGGADFSYQVNAGPIPQDTTVQLFWANGPSFGDVIGGPIFSQAVPAGTGAGTYSGHAEAANLGPPPADATHLLFVTDPSNVLGSSNGSTNVMAISCRPDIAMSRATTTDAITVGVAYSVADANINEEPLRFDVYQSAASDTYSQDDFLGAVTLPATDISDEVLGPHKVQLSLLDGQGNPIQSLRPNPSKQYIIVVANPAGADQIVESDAANDVNDTSWFQKHLMGVVVHGFIPDSLTSIPGWETIMQASLLAQNFEDVIPFNWVASSKLPAADEAVGAGNDLYNQVVQHADTLGQQHDGDVVDIDFIGHSRGAVVISVALQDLVGTTDPVLAGGYFKMTMLDPHPANNLYGQASFNTGGSPKESRYQRDLNLAIGAAAFVGLVDFQTLAMDPQVVIPTNVKEAEVYWQHTSYKRFPGFTNPEHYLNLWGESPANLINEAGIAILDKPLTDVFDSGIGYIGHSEVTAWFQKYVVDEKMLF